MLEGGNYCVFLRAYDVDHVADAAPEAIVAQCLPDAVFGNAVMIDSSSMLADFDRDLQYRGDDSHGPHAGVVDSAAFHELFQSVRSHVETLCGSATQIYDFFLRDGHPAYPVFWDHAFLFRFGSRSTILIGSSAD